VTSAIRSAESEQRQNEAKMSALEQEIISKKQVMFAAETSVEDRYRLDGELSSMQQDLGGLEQRNRQLLVDLAQAQAQLRVLEEKYAYF